MPLPARLYNVIHTLKVLLLAALPAFASVAPVCSGSAPLGSFRLLIRPFAQGAPVPLKSVAEVGAGSRLIWEPVHISGPAFTGAEVAVVAIPASGNRLVILEPRKATARTEWQFLDRPQVIALIFGPQGLSQGRIQTLVAQQPELLRELADYAEQSSQVESLVQELANAEQAGVGAEALLRGFSAQYGVAAPKLDPKAASDQQAAVLLKALLPASGAYDPLAGRNAQAQQTGGLAASVAAMFFGNPVALAAGGATLFQNLKTALFPTTEFRSAFTQTAAATPAAAEGEMALCARNAAPKSKTRTAFLWAYRVPERRKPAFAIEEPLSLPFGLKSKVAVHFTQGSAADLEFTRNWRLTPQGGAPAIPVVVHAAADSLEIDLSKIHGAAGDYRLEASWDWGVLAAEGALRLMPFDNFAHLGLAPGEHDKLVEGSGPLTIRLSGGDFQFLEKASLAPMGRGATSTTIPFQLPLGGRRGAQDSATVALGDLKAGDYRLRLSQNDGVEHELAIHILPANPKLANCPIRLNTGEIREAIHLRASGSGRIQAISSPAGEITGAADAQGWSGEIVLKAQVAKQQRYPLLLQVQGLENPITVADGIEIVGPRPRIVSARTSLPGDPGIETGRDELPGGAALGIALTVEHADAGSRSQLELSCMGGELRQIVKLSPGEASGQGALTLAGPGQLYLSLDPGLVGYAGCRLTATLSVNPEGRSEPFELGRVVRIPRLDRFNLTTEKVGESSYAGILQGRDLDVIDKTGWDSDHGIRVDSIPAPVAGEPARQTLRVVLPWPAPAPHAPLYVWLRGETAGRMTSVVF